MVDREGEAPLTHFTTQTDHIPDDCLCVTFSKRPRDDSGSSSRTMDNSALSEVGEGGSFENVVSNR